MQGRRGLVLGEGVEDPREGGVFARAEEGLEGGGEWETCVHGLHKVRGHVWIRVRVRVRVRVRLRKGEFRWRAGRDVGEG